ncbi:hypothetical protein FQN52_002134 [Onygenales sp. PD_12]|nr:hypothetical protein FQN52_002134 [Onygenales sp. PD_12]
MVKSSFAALNSGRKDASRVRRPESLERPTGGLKRGRRCGIEIISLVVDSSPLPSSSSDSEPSSDDEDDDEDDEEHEEQDEVGEDSPLELVSSSYCKFIGSRGRCGRRRGIVSSLPYSLSLSLLELQLELQLAEVELGGPASLDFFDWDPGSTKPSSSSRDRFFVKGVTLPAISDGK